jgi:uncharacterized protein YgiB involved in biofilm formation
MKRSRYVALLAMGASALALSACGDSETPAGVYSSAEQCIADKQFSESECYAAFDKAREEHEKVAPKYASVSDCEADFGKGKCEEAPPGTHTSSTGVSWMPLLAGYMLGRTLGGQPGFSQPLYRTQNDSTYRNADNRAVTNRTGVQPVPSSTTTSSVKSTTIARGGFGSSGKVYGSAPSGRTGTVGG